MWHPYNKTGVDDIMIKFMSGAVLTEMLCDVMIIETMSGAIVL